MSTDKVSEMRDGGDLIDCWIVGTSDGVSHSFPVAGNTLFDAAWLAAKRAGSGRACRWAFLNIYPGQRHRHSRSYPGTHNSSAARTQGGQHG